MPAKRTASSRSGSRKKRKEAVYEDRDEDSLITEARDNQSAASELEDTTLVSDEEGFASQIFTILVGPQEQKFTAHASFLSQSPVFDRMCHGRFEESRTFTIRLPEDDPKVIKAMIQYLYTGDFTNYELIDVAVGVTSAHAGFQLVDLYKVAEKYQLQQLKTLLLEKLGDIIDSARRPKHFLLIAKQMYTDLPDTDWACRAFIIIAAKWLPSPKLMSKEFRKSLDECISSGGSLAQDLFEAMVSQCEESLLEEKKERKKAADAAHRREQRSAVHIDYLEGERNRLEESAAHA
ncbi:MAG: hypothetical protein Q9186_007068 [Xanthomendoza sp. 1 TL-2023]